MRDIFLTTAFGDQSLIFIYDFYPLSPTLSERHYAWEDSTLFQDEDFPADIWEQSVSLQIAAQDGTGDTYIAEDVLWTYISQLLSAVKAVHTGGLAIRVYDASNIIITSKLRFSFYPR